MRVLKKNRLPNQVGRCVGTVILGLLTVVILVSLHEIPGWTKFHPGWAGSSGGDGYDIVDPGVAGREIASQITLPLTRSAYLPLVARAYQVPAPLWRFGVGQARRSITFYASDDLVDLRFGWYTDWRVTQDAPEPYGIEYVPIVRVKQWKWADDNTWTTWRVGEYYVVPHTYTVSPAPGVIRSVAAANPGMTWIIGNEIERIDWCGGGRQDEILPELYAQAYHELHTLIKEADPTAQIAVGGVIQATPLRLQYLERVWNEYSRLYGQAMPVDVWNVHAFVLQEQSVAPGEECVWGADIPAGIAANSGILYSVNDNKNFSIAWQHIRAMRQWMKNKGEQNKPLIISEYGVNMPTWMDGFSHQQVRDSFMYPSFDHFLNQTDPSLGYPADNYRLVQRWNWYSLDDDSGEYDGGTYVQYFNGNLFYSGAGPDAPGMSALGTYWKQYVQTLPPGAAKPYQQIIPAQSAPQAQSSIPSGVTEPETACLGREIRLVFVPPAPPDFSAGLYRQPRPEAARESVICLPNSH